VTLPQDRRDRLRIYADILRAVRRSHLAGDPPPLTRVQLEVNVPFVRCKEYVEDLQRRGLLAAGSPLALTPQGEAFLREFARVQEFLRRFGFAGGEDRP
jgi:predicted transcriptional regulator